MNIHTAAIVNDCVGQPLAFLLGQQLPVPLTGLIGIFRIVLRIRFRDYNAYYQLIFLDNQSYGIITFFRRLQANILLVLFAFGLIDPPTGAVAILHRSIAIETIPSSIRSLYAYNLIEIEAVCFEVQRHTEAVCFFL